MTKRILCLILTVTLLITMVPYITFSASAEDNMLTDYYWYRNVQFWEIFSFEEDGTVDVYYTEVPLEPSEDLNLSKDFFDPSFSEAEYTWVFDGNTLVVTSNNGYSTQYDLYNKTSNPANIKDLFVEQQIETYDGDTYFYTTDWTESENEWSDNASYFVRLGKKQSENPSTNQSEIPSTNQSDNPSAWNTAYYDYIIDQKNADHSKDWEGAMYELIYLDSDNIPELWIDYGIWAHGCRLVSFNNGSVIEEQLSSGSLSYLEYNNTFLHSGGKMDLYFHRVYNFENGVLTEIAEGQNEVTWADEATYSIDFYWNDNQVTEQTYHQNINSYVDTNTAKKASYDNAYSYDEILNYLASVKQEDTVELKAYTNYPNSTIGTEQEIDIMFELYVNGIKTPIDGYSLAISNPTTIESVDIAELDGTRVVTYRGVHPGTSDLSFTEGVTGATITLSVTVEDQYKHYKCTNLPIPEASCCPIYVADFQCSETGGKHNVKFNAYNTSYAYGVAVVYDEKGEFWGCAPINPRSEGAGVEFIANSIWYAWDEFVTFWSAEPFYKSDGEAKQTEIVFENIPENAEIIITANPNIEDYITFYTTVDIWLKAVCYSGDIDLNTQAIQKSVKEFCEAYLQSLPSNMRDSVIQSIAQQVGPIIRDGVTDKSIEDIHNIFVGISDKIQVNAFAILENILISVLQSGADTLVIAAVPLYKFVDITNKVVALAWPFVSFDSNCIRDYIEIHCVPHKSVNQLVNSSIIVSQQTNFGDNTILDAYKVVEIDELENVTKTIPVEITSSNVYNITLRENGVEVQPDGEIEVRIPVPEGADGEKCVIYRIEENGEKTLMSSTLDNDYLVFKTTHLSYYVVGQDVNKTNPTTNYTGTIIVTVSVVGCIALAVIFAKRKKSRK